jgi:acetolactate synthase-1/2/3 large subunit
MKGSEIIVKFFQESNIEHIFGLAGIHLEPLLDSVYEASDLQYISVRHEQAAGYMACGYSKVKAVPGVCLVNTGPGLMNIIPGIANAFIDSDPMITIIGGKNTSKEFELAAHGDANWLDCLKPITKWCVKVSRPDNILDALIRGYHISMSQKKGPVCIDIPTDIFSKKSINESSLKGIKTSYKNRLIPDVQKIENAASILLKAKNPAIILGGGCLFSDAGKEVLELAENFGIPVASTYVAKGIFPEDHPLSLGILYGKPTIEIVDESDVVLSLGCYNMHFSPLQIPNQTKIIQVDIDPATDGKIFQNLRDRIFILGDIKMVLNSLLHICKKELNHFNKRSKYENIKNLKDKAEKEIESSTDLGNRIHPLSIIKELNRHIGKNAIVVSDNGNNTVWAGYLKVFSPRGLITSSPYGTVGFSLPCAIGAKFAAPHQKVVCVTGDGGLLMNIQELETVNRYKLPILIVLLNDFSYGMTKKKKKYHYGSRFIGTKHDNPDFTKLAESFNIYGEKIERKKDIGPAIERALQIEEPALLDFIIDRDIVPPIYIK